MKFSALSYMIGFQARKTTSVVGKWRTGNALTGVDRRRLPGFNIDKAAEGQAFPAPHRSNGGPAGIHASWLAKLRHDDPSLPPSTWPLVAGDVVDLDEATPGKQWVDTSSNPPLGSLWFNTVTAFNSHCPAEGPF